MCLTARTIRARALSTTVLVALAASPVAAAELTFSESVSLNWNESEANWLGLATTFTSGDDAAVFDSDSNNKTITINDGPIVAQGMRIEGNGITIAGAADTDTLELNNGATPNSANLTINGNQTEISANIAGDRLNIVGTGDNVTLSGDTDATTELRFNIDGTLNLEGEVGALVVNEGRVNADTGSEVTGTTRVNDGRLVVDGGTLSGETTITTLQDGDGILDVDSGTVGDVTANAGRVLISGGTVASLDINGQGPDTPNILEGTGEVTGDVGIDGATLRFDGGNLATDGTALSTVTVGDTGRLLMNGGNVGNITSSGTFAIDANQTVSGFFNSSGTVAVPGSATGDIELDVTGTGVAATDPIFTTSGNITLGGADSLTIDADRITIGAGATFKGTQSLDGTIILDGAITNEADINITAPMTLVDTLTNTGTIDVLAALDADGNDIENNGGTLEVRGAGGVINNGGELTNDSSGTFTIAGANQVIVSNLDNSGTGTSANINGTLNSGAGNSAGATMTVAGTVTGAITNETDAQLNVTGTVGGDLTNSANVLLNGADMDGAIDNNDETGSGGTQGAISVQTGTTTVADGVTNSANFNVDSGRLVIEGTNNFVNEDGGTANIIGRLSSDATDGEFQNQTGATLNLSGRIDSWVDNDGTMNASGDGSLTLGTAATVAGASGTGFGVINDGTLVVLGGNSDAARDQLTITNDLDNNADADINGILVADVDNTGATADLDVNVNGGTTGRITGNVTNADSASATIAGTVDGTLSNSGSADAGISGSVTGNVTNETDATLTVTGNVGGDLTNSATATLDGADMDGIIDNNTDGDITVQGGTTTVAGNVTNAATFDIDSGILALEGMSTFTNEADGDVTIAAGAALNGTSPMNQFINSADAELELGGTIQSWVDNDGTFTTTGTTARVEGSNGSFGFLNDGDFTVGAGTALTIVNGLENTTTATVAGRLTSDLTNTSTGTFTVNGGSLVGDVTNENIFILNGGSVTGNVINNGGFAMGGGVTGDMTNNGTLTVTGTQTLDGALAGGSSSSVDLTAVGSGLTVTGATSAQTAGSGFTVAFGDSTAGATGTLTFGGGVSGAGEVVNLDILNLGLDDLGRDIIDGTFAADNIGNIAGQAANDTNDYFITSAGRISRNGNVTIAATAAGVGLTETIIGAIVNRPTSPYVPALVADLGNAPCGEGVWARATGGAADGTGTFRDQTNGVTGEGPSELTYAGIQAGGDLACFGGIANGWDLAYGAIAGVNVGSIDAQAFAFDNGALTDTIASVTSTDFTQTYVGGYVTAARGSFFSDLQLRFENTDFESNDEQRLGGNALFDDTQYSTRSTTLSGAAGYTWALNEVGDVTFSSSGGFAITRSSTDEIVFINNQGSLVLDDQTTQLGFVSGTLGKSIALPDGNSLLRYFGTATYYEDFAGPRGATSLSDAGDTVLELDSIGSYSEISLGLNFLRVLAPSAGAPRQLNAAVRADYRFGDAVDSWGITAQMRLQF